MRYAKKEKVYLNKPRRPGMAKAIFKNIKLEDFTIRYKILSAWYGYEDRKLQMESVDSLETGLQIITPWL